MIVLLTVNIQGNKELEKHQNNINTKFFGIKM